MKNSLSSPGYVFDEPDLSALISPEKKKKKDAANSSSSRR